jgi:hypothetical protein
MNHLTWTLLALCIVGGCSQGPETIDTSGSHPALGTTGAMTPEAKDAEVDTGRLLVVTPSPGYTVYTEGGHKVAYVEGAVERRLAPGRYFVRLDQRVPGRDFWVTIERGRVTRVENRLSSGAPETVK